MSDHTQCTILNDTVEIRFSAKPPQPTRHRLKSNGFFWSPRKCLWLAQRTPDTIAMAQSLETALPTNSIIEGDCIEVMRQLPDNSIDLVVTDPPYLVNYKDRQGRSLLNDQDDAWVQPAFAETYRLLNPNTFCISFYGWNAIEVFMTAWKQAGFRPVGHMVWEKSYASSSNYLNYHHEQAFLLAKGNPPKPEKPLRDVLPWTCTGNKLHPTQKSVDVVAPLIESFSSPGAVVLDPFCGSGTTAVAARQESRHYIVIEKDTDFVEVARNRLL